MASTARKTLMKRLRQLHAFIYHISGGQMGGSINGSPLLLLTVTGRKSGAAYTIPLAYVRHEGDYLVSASAAGSDHHPAWFANLQSQPNAHIEVSGRIYRVSATVAPDDEREALYALFKSQGDNFAAYEKKTTRKIPVIRLHPHQS